MQRTLENIWLSRARMCIQNCFNLNQWKVYTKHERTSIIMLHIIQWFLLLHRYEYILKTNYKVIPLPIRGMGLILYIRLPTTHESNTIEIQYIRYGNYYLQRDVKFVYHWQTSNRTIVDYFISVWIHLLYVVKHWTRKTFRPIVIII